jgi:hypothetical protein
MHLHQMPGRGHECITLRDCLIVSSHRACVPNACRRAYARARVRQTGQRTVTGAARRVREGSTSYTRQNRRSSHLCWTCYEKCLTDFTIVNVALPSIQRDLHVATTTLQWLVSAYAVAFGGFLLLGGRLADVYGRARMYRIGLVVFVAASILGGLAVEPGLLIASRVVQGIGAAMLAPAGLSLLVTCWSGEQERSRALGTYGAVVSAGFASGAVLGGPAGRRAGQPPAVRGAPARVPHGPDPDAAVHATWRS